MRPLYFRIYLAVLGSLAVFAILAGLVFAVLRTLDNDEPGRWFGWGSDVAERLFPGGRGPTELSSELRFWHERTGFSLMMLSPGGQIIAQAGDFPSDAMTRIRRRADDGRMVWRGRGGLYGLMLDDGRRLVAMRADGRDDFEDFGYIRWLAALLGIGLAVGIAAYPVVRHLTRRLERLEEGVAAFGAGDLSARAAVSGQDEIGRLAQTFNASAERIEQLVTAHKSLLANASHELRSPLARLRMAIEATSPAAPGEGKRAEIERNIAELDALVEEILLASRLQADAAEELRLEKLDLLGLLAEEAAPFGADLAAEDGVVPIVAADARLLRRLVRNLLDNAARHGGGGAAEIILAVRGRQAEIAVCDRGKGVPQAEREKIFEPFYRMRTASESAGGVGLGLALVRQIAERHGGRAAYVEREGGGSCFKVWLPLALGTV